MKVIFARNSAAGADLARSLRTLVSDKILYWGVNPPEPPNANHIHCGSKLDGYEQLVKLTEGKTPTPHHTNQFLQAQEWATLGTGSVWGRTNQHTQGRDIVTPASPKWANRDYWVKQIPADMIAAEWRLHVFAGKSIARGQKTQVEQIARKLAMWVRSRRNGWRLIHTNTPPKGAKHFAKRATDVLGYLWGAVDMLELKPETKNQWADYITNADLLHKNLEKQMRPFVVLEVNQMPGMDNYTQRQYVTAIANFVSNEGDTEPAEEPDGDN